MAGTSALLSSSVLNINDSPFGYCSTGSVDNCSNPLDDGQKHWFSMKGSRGFIRLADFPRHCKWGFCVLYNWDR
ncbi:unnamed protein product [Amaranthus hypochondriacus]